MFPVKSELFQNGGKLALHQKLIKTVLLAIKYGNLELNKPGDKRYGDNCRKQFARYRMSELWIFRFRIYRTNTDIVFRSEIFRMHLPVCLIF